MAKILRVLGTTKKYGGDLFEDELAAVLASYNEVNSISVIDPKLHKFQGIPYYLKSLKGLQEKALGFDFVYRPMNHVFFLKPGPKHIVSAFHYDTAFCHPLVKAHHYLSLKSLIAHKGEIRTLVVISKYWQDFFFQVGFRNIELLYCGFESEKFQISAAQVEEFRQRFSLSGKKVIYIGNAQKKKGADLVYSALKDSGYHLVTSGTKDLELPVPNLNLNHQDYLCLLKAAGLVITYSQFKEGWNRVAHEAMLVGTPVVGSGLGGMGELLAGGGQAICTNVAELPKEVARLYGNKDAASQGYEYSHQFTMERFRQKALEIFS